MNLLNRFGIFILNPCLQIHVEDDYHIFLFSIPITSRSGTFDDALLSSRRTLSLQSVTCTSDTIVRTK
jgi:hypothetical protein